MKSTVTNKVYWKADADIRKLKKNSGVLFDESNTIHLLYEDTDNIDRYQKLYLSEMKNQKLQTDLYSKKMKKIDVRYDTQRLKDK